MLILVTGCSATYDLYIGNNLTDDISILEDKERLKTIKEYNMEDDTIFNTDNLSYNIYSLESGFDYKRQEISNDTTSTESIFSLTASISKTDFFCKNIICSFQYKILYTNSCSPFNKFSICCLFSVI